MLTTKIGCLKTARIAIPWDIKPNLPPIGAELLFGPIRNNSRSWIFSVQHPRNIPLKMA